jgi:outer membrane protein with beta-barrel domain
MATSRKYIRKRALAALLPLVASAAYADDPAVGFYLGAGVGTATLELEDSNSIADFEGDDTGFKVAAGYRFLKWVAVEAAYQDYGQPEDDVLGLQLRGEFNAFSVSALGLLPLGNFDLFARGGIARWDGSLTAAPFGVEVSEDNTDPLFGLGAQYRLGQLAIRLEYEALLLGFDDDQDDEADGDDWVDLVSVGVTWTF